MTRREQKALIQKLQSLRGTPVWQNPPPGSMEQGLAILRAHMGQTLPLPKFSFAQKLCTKLNFVPFLVRSFVPPQFAYTVAVFALVISATAAGYMSRQALPGTSLYSTKIALEYTQARLVSNPSERAKVQMDMAGRRLQELRAITEQAQEPNGRVEKTLKQFTKEVKSAKNTLKQAGDPLQAEEAAQDLAKKARQYEDELLKAKAQVKPGREVGVAAMEEALKEVSGH